MYIIDDTYFKSPKREVSNLEEADSKSFQELIFLIDDECRLFMYHFLTSDEVINFNSYLVDGMFPENTTGIPQKWIDLVSELIQIRGNYKSSLLADFVYVKWLETQASYMTGVGDAKGNPKGASNVNPTQRIVNVWNEFVEKYNLLIKFIKDNPESYVKETFYIFEFKNQLGI